MTTRAVGAYFAKLHQGKSVDLWGSTCKCIAYICERYHRKEARQILRKLYRQTSQCSSSAYYLNAARMLS